MKKIKNYLCVLLVLLFSTTACLSQTKKELWHLVRNQDTLKLSSLIENGFDINRLYKAVGSNRKDDCLLNQAIWYKKRELTEFILRQPDIQIQRFKKDRQNTLHYLAGNGWFDLAKQLIESGVDPNTLGRKDLHILRITLYNYLWTNNPNLNYKASALEFIKYLYTKGIDPELSITCCRKKTTILIFSVLTEHQPTIEYLLTQHKESINSIDKKGKTALHFAVEHESEVVAKLLLKNGANSNALDKKGKSPLDYALKQQNKGMIKIIKTASNK